VPPRPAESGNKTEIFFIPYFEKIGGRAKKKNSKRKFLFCASPSLTRASARRDKSVKVSFKFGSR
jgi:hypothetical protein